MTATMVTVKRVPPDAPGVAPYYFTWTLTLGDGTRVSQYDERGRLWLIGHPTLAPRPELESVLRSAVSIEVYPHALFGANAPSAKLLLSWPWGLEYDGRLPVSTRTGKSRPYYKQGLTVISEGNGLYLRAEPADLATAGNPPDASYVFHVGRVSEMEVK